MFADGTADEWGDLKVSSVRIITQSVKRRSSGRTSQQVCLLAMLGRGKKINENRDNDGEELENSAETHSNVRRFVQHL